MVWYFAKNGLRKGPVSDVDFRDLAAKGEIQPEDLVWTEEFGATWRKANTVPDLTFGARVVAPPPPPPPNLPSETSVNATFGRERGNTVICPNCGKEAHPLAIACPGCGIALGAPYARKPTSYTKSKVAAGLLGVFLNCLGIHKFYLGYSQEGLIMLLVSIFGGIITCGVATGVMSIIGFIEGIVYLTKSDEEFEQIYVKNHKGWF